MEEAVKETVNCKNCNKPLKPHWEFCPYCKQPVHVKPKKCKKCGEELEEGMVICPVCGKAATSSSAGKSAAKKKPVAYNAPLEYKTSVAHKASAEHKAPAVYKEKPFKPVTDKVNISDVSYRNLFDAYTHGKLPFSNGYIVSSFFSDTSYYGIYEIVSYAGVKEIFMTPTGLQFITGGKKLYILVEPDSYQIKYQEPVSRAEGEKIPKRFNELEIITAKNQTKIMIAKEPNESYGSFTILKPTGINFAVVFYNRPDMYNALVEFFTETLNRQRRVPEHDAKLAAQVVTNILKKHMGFEGEYR